MPRFDRTGPSGQGSRTGRQMGKCGQKSTATEEVLTNEFPRHKRLRLNANKPSGQGNRFGHGNHKGNQDQKNENK